MYGSIEFGRKFDHGRLAEWGGLAGSCPAGKIRLVLYEEA
jgi:hypothetical protein